jgi:hypothetical protein
MGKLACHRVPALQCIASPQGDHFIPGDTKGAAPVITMPFGKHKGRPLCDIPTAYLAWVIRECESADWWLREAVEHELDRRIHDDGDASGGAGPNALAFVGSVISRWWRKVALRYHPDRGGDTKVMQALNEAHCMLKEVAGVK